MQIAHRICIVFTILLAGCNGTGEKKLTEDSMPADKPTQSTQPTSKPAMIFGLGRGFELAPKGTYSAAQNAGEVTITAKGENPTAGYEVKLVQSPLRIWPPQWMLARKPPEGAVAQVITPFEVTASFKSDDPIKSVIVADAAARHEVPVQQP